MGSGGKREGCGRKSALPGEKRVQLVITIEPKTRDKMKEISTKMGIKPGRLIDMLIENLEFEED